MEKKEQLSPILKATTEMLKHFGCEHEDALSRLRDIKTELFELNIRLDELNRTRNLYSLNTSRKKNVFSPIQSQDASNQLADHRIIIHGYDIFTISMLPV